MSSSDSEDEKEFQLFPLSDLPTLPDLESIQATLKSSLENASQGEIGQRGEVYFIAQAILVLCILGGGVPYFGDTLLFLAGPGLLILGAAVIVAGLVGLGATDGITPWPKPLEKTELVTTGIYSYIRHPMYAGLLSSMMGISVLSESAIRVLLTFVLYLVLDAKANYEESELNLLLPEYADYQDNLVKGRFFPAAILELFENSVESFNNTEV
eukprot:CAMPEP_0197830786 /NCGR_PEP_ID=MMETSP1437-20131217/7401_1 /TAXON_ID=49252 ORGANISM="Eucampia antarctica, Strain CCMP1452" /NCGR_SAMPLE_ID=MMETSP1437 /ASSEMBLY_ACC=CAM_ASM_001096 /LENGTH=211 /DNA_ID=CAMNT_0043433397 /DNA_START=310 /DNA_END=945 /DNA_ORIENTATION=-